MPMRSRTLAARRARAAHVITQRWRRYVRLKRSKGLRPGPGPYALRRLPIARPKKFSNDPIGVKNVKTAKRYQVYNSTDNQTGATRLLYNIDITEIPGSVSPGINQRERDCAYVLGSSIRLQFANRKTYPHFFNIAVISPKTSNNVLNGGSDTSIPQFFRAHTSARSQSFSAALTSLEHRTLPINTDVYNVYRHFRFVLHTNAGSTGYPSGAMQSWCTKDFYFKINRRLNYVTSSPKSTTPVWLVWWCDQIEQGTGGLPINESFWFQAQVVTYFHDIS